MTFRARVLAVVNAAHGWMTAREIAAQAGIHYHQAIFALNALLNAEIIARQGRKSTARWGSLVLVEHTPNRSAIYLLESLLNGR